MADGLSLREITENFRAKLMDELVFAMADGMGHLHRIGWVGQSVPIPLTLGGMCVGVGVDTSYKWSMLIDPATEAQSVFGAVSSQALL